MKEFNTAAICIPEKHYMVDLSERIIEIKKMIDSGKYFTINRARQYGKTTTIAALKRALKDDYIVVGLDFQGIGDAGFETEQTFVKSFSRMLLRKNGIEHFFSYDIEHKLKEYISIKDKSEAAKLDELFLTLIDWCNETEKPVVLIIDEVDSATNNQVFLDFLAQLRLYYLEREEYDSLKTFQSVILAGVTDIKHLKTKIREDDEIKENSPWNIAADFDIDMSLSENGIKGMLEEYEADHNIGMDTTSLARYIREYTSGYPFLVSRICQIIDTKLVPQKYDTYSEAWTIDGVDEAVKSIIAEDNTLFDSIMGKLKNMPTLKKRLKDILLGGDTVAYLPDDSEQKLLRMYGFIVNNHNTVSVANRIFEMRLYKFFIGESKYVNELNGNALDNKPDFIKGGMLNVPLIMERFIETQKYIRDINDELAEKKFIEEEGREKFLTYLSPIINGVGTYSIEEQTRDRKRMDVVIHYLGRRYVIELKIWHGDRYNEKGEKQITEYLDRYGLEEGYMLSFNFNKKKTIGVTEVHIGEKTLYEGII